MAFDANKNMITAAFVAQFSDSFDIAAQQQDSRLQAAVKDLGKITGASFTINDMGSIDATQITTRFGDTAWDLPEAGTRIVLMANYDLFVLVEKCDLRELIEYPDRYLQFILAVFNRKKDDVIYSALLGSVLRKTSDNGAFASTALPVTQKIVSGNTTMTKNKLIAAKTMFRRNECDEQNGEELYITYNADMLTQILSDSTLTNVDYMALRMLQEGAVSSKWLGFNWLAYEKLNKTGTTFTAAAWCKSAVHFGIGAYYNIKLRCDKNNTIQISFDASYGAGRAAENKVVAIDFVA